MALDTSGYEAQRRNVQSQFAASSAANEYGRFVAQQRGSRQLGDAARTYSRGWPKMGEGWNRRGHTGAKVNSGFYQQAMQQYVGDYQRQRNDLTQNLGNERTRFDLNQSQLEVERERALAQIEMEKQRAIALLAQNIQAIRPGVGG